MLWRTFLGGLLLVVPFAVPAYSQQQSTPSVPPATPQADPTSPGSTSVRPMRIRVGGNVQWANITHMVQPEYPEDARQKHISGTVELHVIVAADSPGKKVEYVSGPQELMDSSIESIKRWRYRSTLLNNQPVEVDSTIHRLFALDKKRNLKPQPRNH
jgi:hypothetical protein